MKKAALIPLFFLNACVYLTFDNSKASPLVMVSRTPTPAAEEVRSFVQYGDLVYVAAGSGGLLVYRTVGDKMQPVPSLAITNIYADNLDPVFVRTVEIVESPASTNLIFAFDTVAGGGIGAAEISSVYTKPLGSLTALEGMRIRRTDSRIHPEGGFSITAANEYTGVMTYRLSVVSNNFFDQQNLASIASYVALQGLGGAFQPFMQLQAPGTEGRSSVTNFEALLELFKKDPKRALDLGTNLPFLTEAQRKNLQNAASASGILSNTNLLNAAAKALTQGGGQVLDLANQFLGGGSPLAPPPAPAEPANASNLQIPPNVQELTALAEGAALPPAQPAEPLNPELLLSNMAAMTNFTVDPEVVNTADFNPFITSRPIKDAAREIDLTASSFGLQGTADDQGVLKERLQGLSSGEQNAVFDALFNQADLLTRLVPLLEKSGFNPRQLYQFWQEGRINEIIEKLDTALLADMIKLLPQTRIEVKLAVENTNALLPSIRNMSSDARSFYLALGKEGFAVINRGTDKVLKTVKLPFSEVEALVPFEAYGKNWLAVADRLDGLSIYERGRDDSPGNRAAKINLVGEGMNLYAQGSLLWLADGSNGVLAVRFNKDKSLSIEGEFFDKQGIARYIGTARPREALVSYGADGFVRLRFTNITEENPEQNLDQKPAGKTFAQRTLEWNESSPFFRFLRRIF